MTWVQAYPRVRGGNGRPVMSGHGQGGLSPRARGKPQEGKRSMACSGPIPACAGETLPHDAAHGLHRAYPRVRGGNFRRTTTRSIRGGLSPRARGKLQDRAAGHAG